MSGGDRTDTAPAASGEAKEKAVLRTRSASRLSLVARPEGFGFAHHERKILRL